MLPSRPWLFRSSSNGGRPLPWKPIGTQGGRFVAPYRLVDQYGELDLAVEFTGDELARIKWLFDGTHNVHTEWKDNS